MSACERFNDAFVLAAVGRMGKRSRATITSLISLVLSLHVFWTRPRHCCRRQSSRYGSRDVWDAKICECFVMRGCLRQHVVISSHSVGLATTRGASCSKSYVAIAAGTSYFLYQRTCFDHCSLWSERAEVWRLIYGLHGIGSQHAGGQ